MSRNNEVTVVVSIFGDLVEHKHQRVTAVHKLTPELMARAAMAGLEKTCYELEPLTNAADL